MKKLLMAVVACAASAACAQIYYFTGASDASWQDKDSYRVGSRTGDVPLSLPGAGDDVWIGGESSAQTKSVTLGAADLALASALHSINVRYGELTIDVPTDTHLACAINGANESGVYGRYGRVIKKGAGALYLDCFGAFLASKQPADYLFGEMVIEEGDVYLQKDNAGTISGGYFGVLDVGEGCTFYLPNVKTSTYNFDGLNGKGQICLIAGYAPAGGFELKVGGAQNRVSNFEGYLTGALKISLTENSNHGAVQYLSNPTNDFTGQVFVSSGANNVIGFLHGGNRDEAQSLGKNTAINLQNSIGADSSRLLYLGEGNDAMDKIVNFGPGTTIVDAGEHGGLTLAGSKGYLWFNNYTYTTSPRSVGRPGVGRLVLTGNGMNTLHGPFYNKDEYDAADNHGYPLSIVKSGKGTWLLKHNAVRQYNSVVAADEGTLQFETIIPISTNACSLGRGTKTYDPDYAHSGEDVDETKKVGYQLRVGGGTTSGTLEYVGTAAVENKDRILAVNGSGTFKNSSGKMFVQDGIVTTDRVGEHTLTLAGGDGTARNITNVVGKLNVAKEGAGAWTLDRQLDINGMLEVREGTLTVYNPTKYTWFRFTVKENMRELREAPTFSANVRVREFAFYDADGNRRDVGLTRRAGNDTENLSEGQVGIQQGFDNTSGDATKYWVNMAFDGAAEGSGFAFYGYGPLGNDSAAVPTGKGLIPEREDSWLRMVVRLPDDVPEIKAFDYVCIANGPAAKGGDALAPKVDSWYVAEPRIYTMEGSADGIHWSEPLYVENDSWANHIARGNCWASSDGAEPFKADEVRKDKGFAIDTTPATTPALTDVKGVSVAKGATLKLIGDIAPLKGLKIDAQDGMGTITGKPTLAASGVLDLTNVPDAKNFTVPVDWSQFANPEAVDGWTLSVNGVPSSKLVFTRTAEGVRIDARGMGIFLY